ncbi:MULTISPECIES: pyruvate, phosphate dikinase [unclassified Breznakia]|uniref:pyruvate, phosphate dikinase n=1 Tax=unclassified Breznakia TaxID=2623764 RepID=UPI002476D0FC|nr:MULTISPECIES: pyruvate, phosphate dikinase [unclassified Breznakia]MDH6367436.1 pyruvate,orthophosphate dikinase [Breznakia sp. PH1-1]MDH6404591.1 pyruvate,orthophosphate dikinase [Breznakia sp. PF1-11]MDH6412300.1 pyruvate,orthophosphate dikinase [Breznakia sp. PFB1-11]MDH6414603.1 pyruvate,orthophosphate dikinase [Breznakia sp. PFB1-14]MDH6416974.1 pyruvate,orthophosphate dikinase [Breznakia sp. PFB1-4]
MGDKFVYSFHEGNETMRNLLGGKGANLAEMINLGMPVPDGFTVTTEACNKYYDDGETIDKKIIDEIFTHLTELEKSSGKVFGDPNNPLLVSVRSGSRASMPGMMDTILNLGLNDEVVEGLAKLTNNPRFAYDSYRRFIQMFADVVMGLSKSKFETVIDDIKAERKVELDTDLTTDDLKEMVRRFKSFYHAELKSDFPLDPKDQLALAIEAVFKSWNNPRAIYYRKMNDIPSSWGTAVNVQMMVFGNMGETSGTGVAFTRSPSTGDNQLFGEFLMNAQGEDVVAGIRTPNHISELQKVMPEVYDEFVAISKRLEEHYHDMQDMEFTIENKKLYMLQTRNGKRTAKAALKIACDLVSEGLLTKKEAILMVNPSQLDALLHPQFDQDDIKGETPIATGLPASPGAATGQVVFNAEDAANYAQKGHRVILVRLETSPEDIEGMNSSKGILTVRGGMTSHAAVVARGMGICCVSGVGDIKINEENKTFTVCGKTYKEYDYISLDGSTGNVYGRELKTVPAAIEDDFETFMNWADEFRTLKVRTNADTPRDAKQALAFGAEGIGLVRTEHMFFEGERIKAIREMIVSKTSEQRSRALTKLLPMQKGDFEAIYEAMQGRPVTIRYLDPPLHEFLPTSSYDITQLALDMGMEVDELKGIIQGLHEFNPMMGHRGVRLDISYPEIAEMQTRAVIEAAIAVNKRNADFNVVPEIMIPLVGDVAELRYVKAVVKKVADEIIEASGEKLDYMVGTMIEIPRAALTADEIAEEAEFFSFGTNDLTQMTFGFSRDDAGGFLSDYYDKHIYEQDPFQRLDQKGVGKLVKNAVDLGKKTRPNIKLGICGEHGGDPSSVEFFHNVGLQYVSCSPFRVPIARLAAAQAAIRAESK